MASVHDKLTQYDPKMKIPKKMEQEKTIPNVENVPIEENSQPATVKENQARTIVHDSSSNTWLSQD